MFTLNNYQILPPPYPLTYRTWTERQAQDYLNWFVSKIPERVDYLCRRYHRDNFLNRALDPGDPKSLIRIWRWFLPRAKIEQMPPEEAKAHLAAYSYLGGAWLDTRRLSTCTEYVMRDIGMLLGHIFTTNYPQQIYWTTEKLKKGYVWRWHPVLKGFVYMVDEKPTYPSFEPVHMVGVQGSRLLNKSMAAGDLFHIYQIWEEQIPIVKL